MQQRNIPPDSERLTDLLYELDAHNRAVESVDGEIRNEEIKASRVVCEHAAPEHSRLAKKFAAKVIELHAAHQEYLQFVYAIENTGARLTSLGRVGPNYLGSPTDPCGFYHFVLEDFVENRHIKKSDVPESVR